MTAPWSYLTRNAVDQMRQEIERASRSLNCGGGQYRYGVLWSEEDCRAADDERDRVMEPLLARLGRLEARLVAQRSCPPVMRWAWEDARRAQRATEAS